MEQNRQAIADEGLGLAAISYDSPAVLKAFADRQHIGYTLLSDADSAVIRRYGIFNEEVEKGNPAYGIPHPGTYLLDTRGVVVAKYFEDDIKVRDTSESILFRRFGLLAKPQENIEAKHLRLITSGGTEAMRPNQRVTLAVDVELPPRMHVYAPAVTGYIPISLKLEASPAWKADPVSFPPAKTMRLEAIRETVPVYEGTFRLLETITLAGAKELEPLLDGQRHLTVEGELRYQACDDRECFVPETVPVRWTVRVLPFDPTRAPEPLRRK